MAKKKTAKRAAKKATRKDQGNPAAGKTQISISLPGDLVEKIDSMAASENPNRSNFIANALENLTKGS